MRHHRARTRMAARAGAPLGEGFVAKGNWALAQEDTVFLKREYTRAEYAR
jgi:hypothetical protein